MSSVFDSQNIEVAYSGHEHFPGGSVYFAYTRSRRAQDTADKKGVNIFKLFVIRVNVVIMFDFERK